MKRYLLPAGFIFLGFLILIFYNFEFGKPASSLAQVLSQTGDSAKLRKRSELELNPLKKYIGNRDILISNDSVVSLKILNSKVTVDIFKNSIVIFKIIDSKTSLTFLEGNFKLISGNNHVRTHDHLDLIMLTIEKPIFKRSLVVNDTDTEDPYITRVMNSNYELFEKCYKRFLLKNPFHSGGFVSVAFGIDTSGYVSYIKVADSSIDDTDLQKCVISVIKGTRFSNLKTKTFVTYPIKFSSTN